MLFFRDEALGRDCTSRLQERDVGFSDELRKHRLHCERRHDAAWATDTIENGFVVYKRIRQLDGGRERAYRL